MTEEVLRKGVEALQELNLDKILSIYSEDAVFEDIPANLLIDNKAELSLYFERLFTSPGAAFSDFRILESDEFAVIEWVWTAQQVGLDQQNKVRGVSVIELKEGKISRERIYYNLP